MNYSDYQLNESFEILIGELVEDEEFRDRFLRQPERMLREATEWALPLSESQRQALLWASASYRLRDRVAEEIEARFAAAASAAVNFVDRCPSSLPPRAGRGREARQFCKSEANSGLRPTGTPPARSGAMVPTRPARLLRPLLLIVAVNLPGAPVAAQIPAQVRVIDDPAPIRRWFRQPVTDVLVVVDPGTTLDVLDRERGWYWVVLPRDAHGTRRAGWIDLRHVEAVSRPASARGGAAGTADGRRPQAAGVPTEGSIPEDRVTITTTGVEGTPGTATSVSMVSKYRFEDVHFDRDRAALRAEDLATLRQVAAALKSDPMLAVNIEGYACSLGSAAYNLALGARRAAAVKDFLVGEGILADRLHTISLGEEHARHDNAQEETRRLNRRVALVPDVRR